jgi:Recombinase
VMRRARDDGATYQKVADMLSDAAVPTARGGEWTPTQVRRCLLRAATAENLG